MGGCKHLPKDFSDVVKEYIGYKAKWHLDVAQLIKHMIGLLIKGKDTRLKPILVYIYWQPANWYDFDIYHKHIEEINEFKTRIEKYISFVPMSYLDFWQLYQNDSFFGSHILKVKERYYFNI